DHCGCRVATTRPSDAQAWQPSMKPGLPLAARAGPKGIGPSGPSSGQLNTVWKATVAIGKSSSRTWVQPRVAPTVSLTDLRQPRAMQAPTRPSKFGFAPTQVG